MKNSISLLFALLFTLSLQSQTGWTWQNPLPQGNPLYGISFLMNHGWAVGPHGTAIHTTDGGLTWQRIDLGTTENLNAVYMHDDLMAWIVGDNGLILFVMEHVSTNTFEITKQISNTTVNLRTVTSDINNCPWVGGDDGTVLRTNDFGQTWEEQYTPFDYDIYGFHNIECTEAWTTGPEGIMMYTYNSGNSWSYLPTPVNYLLFSVHVGTFENIRVTGQQGLIMHTDDKGVTWNIENEEPGYNLYDVINIGLNTAYAVGTNEKILETIDYGETWTEPGIDIQLNNTPLYDVEDQWAYDHVWVVGHHGVILKNSGIQTEFEVQNEGTLYALSSVEFIDENNGWAIGGEYIESGNSLGIILHTTDGGETWEEQLNTSIQLYALDMVNENEGWVVGRDGSILHTSNGGASWQTQDSPIGGMMTSVCFADENNGWIVTMDYWGEVIHTTNGGATWTPQTNPSANPLHDVFFINQDVGWAVGLDSSVIRTSNGGDTWEWFNVNASQGYRFASVYFVDELHGWMAGILGSIMRTTDGGDTWQEINSGTDLSFNDIYFIDQYNGWAVGDQGIILHSVDGGITWFKQQSKVYPNFLTSVSFIDGKKGWISGEGGTIINTVNGGFVHEYGTFWVEGLDLPITDGDTTESTIFVDVSDDLKQNYILTGIELFIDTIFHSRVSDLEIYLSHNEITDTLVFHVNSQGENFLWTKLLDEATTIITDGIAPFSGNYNPFSALSVFNGSDPNGDWTLRIYDSEGDHEGILHAWGIKPLFEKIISVNEYSKPGADQKIQLLQNAPNPFGNKTKISWQNEVSGQALLKVYNINGQEIATLINRFIPAGEYSIDFDGSGLSTGVYYYQLTIGHYSQTKKMIIQK